MPGVTNSVKKSSGRDSVASRLKDTRLGQLRYDDQHPKDSSPNNSVFGTDFSGEGSSSSFPVVGFDVSDRPSCSGNNKKFELKKSKLRLVTSPEQQFQEKMDELSVLLDKLEMAEKRKKEDEFRRRHREHMQKWRPGTPVAVQEHIVSLAEESKENPFWLDRSIGEESNSSDMPSLIEDGLATTDIPDSSLASNVPSSHPLSIRNPSPYEEEPKRELILVEAVRGQLENPEKKAGDMKPQRGLVLLDHIRKSVEREEPKPYTPSPQSSEPTTPIAEESKSEAPETPPQQSSGSEAPLAEETKTEASLQESHNESFEEFDRKVEEAIKAAIKARESTNAKATEKEVPPAVANRKVASEAKWKEFLEHKQRVRELVNKAAKFKEENSRYAMDLKHTVKHIFNRIGGVAGVKENFLELRDLLRGKQIYGGSTGQKLIQITINHSDYQFTLLLIVDGFLDQAASNCSRPDIEGIYSTLFPLAQVGISLLAEFKKLREVFLSRTYSTCPWLFPYWDLEVSSVDQRVGMVRLFAAMCVSSCLQGSPNPLGPGTVWTLLASIGNLDPTPLITPTVLLQVLSITSYDLALTYNVQFTKLFRCLRAELLPKLEAGSRPNPLALAAFERVSNYLRKEQFVNPRKVRDR